MPVHPRYSIYYEKQLGGLCRMHSLNAFFGKAKISPSTFQDWIRLYDLYLKKRFNVNTSSASYDLVNSDQTNLVSFVLKKYKIHVRYYALNSVYGKRLDPEIYKANFIFVYNFGHIWGIRKKNRKYYKVDSMSGVSPFGINHITSIKNIGLMVPVSLRSEWNLKVSLIRNILSQNGIHNKQQLAKYLRMLREKKRNIRKYRNSTGCCNVYIRNQFIISYQS